MPDHSALEVCYDGIELRLLNNSCKAILKEPTMLTAQEIIQKLGLVPHPDEGGYFRETYRSTERIPASALPPRYPSEKAFNTAIYYLLTPETSSQMHRLLSEEIFHFYLGDTVEMVILYPDGHAEQKFLGTDIDHGEQVQLVIPRSTWFGGFLKAGGRYALMGTTVAPGFDYADYETGNRRELILHYPGQKDLIRRLTPESG